MCCACSMLRSKSKGIDRKYFMFGEGPEEGELDHILGRVRRTLRETTDGILAAAEVSGSRISSGIVTAPGALNHCHTCPNQHATRCIVT
jgi:hypothetical protein